MKLVLVADWLTTFGGAERALAEFHAVWPHSPMYASVARPGIRDEFGGVEIRTSRLQRIYRLTRRYQLLLPLMPRAMEEFDLRGYDVILSSSHAVAKGIVPPSNAVHVCYCHTPMRYAWEMEDQYLQDFHIPKILRGGIKKQLSRLRRWDLSTAKRVDVFLANSTETAGRIERIYGRDSIVIPPPIHEKFFGAPLVPHEKRTAFLAVGRLVPYKRFDLLIECANALKIPLTIVGRGREAKRLKAMAGPTVTMRGRVTDEELPSLYASAKAVLFPTFEDAGIVPLEAQACGTPVIAYGKGGTLDTVVHGKTGLFFTEQTIESLKAALKELDTWKFDPAAIREHAKQFSSTGFRKRIREEVEKAWQHFRPQKKP